MAEIGASAEIGAVVDWDMPELERLRTDQDLLDPDIVRSWISSAALMDDEQGDGGLEGIDTLIEAADGSLERFQRMASAAVEDPIQRLNHPRQPGKNRVARKPCRDTPQ